LTQTKPIKEQIGLLMGLQVVDKEIYALNNEKSKCPEKIKYTEEALEAKKTGIKQADEDLKKLQVRLKDNEITLQQKEDQIKKLETQLFQLKTNKEYSTMLTEIKGVKADNSLIEEEIIKLMDGVDNTKEKIGEEKELFKKEEVASQKEKEMINARIKEIDSKLQEFSAKRQDIIPSIDKQILARYDRVLNNRDGLAMVPIEHGSCGGCNMNLPPQVISDAKLREDIIVCGSCSRILYIDENVEVS